MEMDLFELRCKLSREREKTEQAMTFNPSLTSNVKYKESIIESRTQDQIHPEGYTIPSTNHYSYTKETKPENDNKE